LEKIVVFSATDDELVPPVYLFFHSKPKPFSPIRAPGLDDKVRENTPRLILNQFRWLEHVVNPGELAKGLLELVDIVFDQAIKREIISAIPEIVDDAQHQAVVDSLNEKLAQDPQLTAPIIECFSNLSLKPNLLDTVRTNVLEQLERADNDVLPVVVQFLLQTATQDTVARVVEKLRLDITFDHPITSAAAAAAAAAAKSQSSRKAGRRSVVTVERSAESFLFETLKAGLHFQKFVVDEWLQQISRARDRTHLKPLDLIALIILSANPMQKKRVVQIYRRKVEEGFCTIEALGSLLTKHASALLDHFIPLLSLADTFLRLPLPAHRLYGSHLYAHLFKEYEAYQKQEVVGAVVTHVGSRVASEVDAGLSVLTLLAERSPKDLATFSVFLQRIMDNLDDFTLDQVRCLFTIFNTVAHHVSDPEHFLNDINLVIRKQLSHEGVRYKRLGIVSGVAMIRLPPSSASPNAELFRTQAKNLLNMMTESCHKQPACFSLIYDELSVLVESGSVDLALLQNIQENFCSKFTEFFVGTNDEEDKEEKGDNDEVVTGEAADPTEVAYGLNSLGISIRLYTLLTHPNQQESARIQYLCSNFRLWVLCLKAEYNGSLEDVTGVLGAGLVLHEDPKVFSLLPVEKREKICASIFLTLDWIRELLNAFVGQQDKVLQTHLLGRVSHLVAFEQRLRSYLPHVARFTVPGVTIPDSVFLQAKKARATKGKGKGKGVKGKGKGKGKAKAEEEGEDQQQLEEDEPRKEYEEPAEEYGRISSSSFFSLVVSHFISRVFLFFLFSFFKLMIGLTWSWCCPSCGPT
jgi:Fanconi anemia group D2 protein